MVNQDQKNAPQSTSRITAPGNNFILAPEKLYDDPNSKLASEEWGQLEKAFKRFIELNKGINGMTTSAAMEWMLVESFLRREAHKFVDTLGIVPEAMREEMEGRLDEIWTEKTHPQTSRYRSQKR